MTPPTPSKGTALAPIADPWPPTAPAADVSADAGGPAHYDTTHGEAGPPRATQDTPQRARNPGRFSSRVLRRFECARYLAA